MVQDGNNVPSDGRIGSLINGYCPCGMGAVNHHYSRADSKLFRSQPDLFCNIYKFGLCTGANLYLQESRHVYPHFQKSKDVSICLLQFS